MGEFQAMARRSAHTGAELRELILDAAEGLIESNGLAGLSAREIAKRIGYSPGTIYNVFNNLDDVILHVEARMLDELSERLAAVKNSAEPHAYVHELAQTYLAFTHEHPKLWNLRFEHHLPVNSEIPVWYKEKLDGLIQALEGALTPLLHRPEQGSAERAARALWAGVHGITSISTAGKLSSVTTDVAGGLVQDLVTTFLAGLKAQPLLARRA